MLRVWGLRFGVQGLGEVSMGMMGPGISVDRGLAASCFDKCPEPM